MSSIIGNILVIQEFNAQKLTSAKFNTICRCCLSEGQMYPIFGMDYKGLIFIDLLKLCSSLEVNYSTTIFNDSQVFDNWVLFAARNK